MSFGQEPEDDYECVDHGDPNIAPINIKSADLLAVLKGGNTRFAGSPPVRPRYTNPPESEVPPPLPPSSSKKSIPGIPAKSIIPPPVIPRSQTDSSPSRMKKKNYNDVRINYNDVRVNKMESSMAHSVTPQHHKQLTSSLTSSEEGETLMLADLVRKYSRSLPLRIRVDEGYCGSEERFVISSGDVYNFHFLKNEKVVSVQDCGNASFSIPLNSSIKFGLLYDPNNNFKEALKGFSFSSVSDVCQAKTTPRVLRVKTCLQQAQLSDGKSLEKDEVLLVKKTGKSMLRKPFLKVYSCTTREEKTITDDSGATFTTTPNLIALHLTDILDAFSEAFPLDAMMYPPDDDDMDDLPPHLRSDKVTITHISIESAVIATTCWDESSELTDPDSDDTLPVSIPIEMEIEVTILYVDQEDLYETTKSFINNMDLSRIKDMKDATERDAGRDRRPSKIGRRVREGYEWRGMDFTMSDQVYNEHEAMPLSLPFRSVLNQPLPPIPPEGAAPETPPTKPRTSAAKPPTPPPTIVTPPLPVRSSKNYPEVKPRAEAKFKLPPVAPRDRAKSPQRGTQSVENGSWKVKTVNVIKPGPLKSSSLDAGEDAVYANQATPNLVSPVPRLSQSSEENSRSSPPNGSEDQASGKEVTELRLSVKSLRALVDAVQENTRKQLSGMREEMGRLSQAMAGLRADCLTLKQELAHARSGAATSHDNIPRTNTMSFAPPISPWMSGPHSTGISALTPEQEQDNLRSLKGLNNSEVLVLLEAMKLSQYKDSFAEETIDGEVLAECDEQILENELGVTNKLHRMRLLKLVSGRHSSHYYFTEGLDPYGQLAAPS